MSQVTITHSAIRRGRRLVLEPGTLHFDADSVAGIVGLNGAGKSTLFNGIADLLTKRAGQVTIGIDAPDPRIAHMPQQPALPRWLTVEEAALLYGVTFDELENACPGLRLNELRGHSAGALSGGQLQGLVFSLCWSLRADITLLDEPFANMDMGRRRAAIRLIQERDSGLILLSAQAAADLVECCDSYTVLRQGRYVFTGRARELVTEDDGGHGGLASAQRIESRLIELLELGVT